MKRTSTCGVCARQYESNYNGQRPKCGACRQRPQGGANGTGGRGDGPRGSGRPPRRGSRDGGASGRGASGRGASGGRASGGGASGGGARGGSRGGAAAEAQARARATIDLASFGGGPSVDVAKTPCSTVMSERGVDVEWLRAWTQKVPSAVPFSARASAEARKGRLCTVKFYEYASSCHVQLSTRAATSPVALRPVPTLRLLPLHACSTTCGTDVPRTWCRT